MAGVWNRLVFLTVWCLVLPQPCEGKGKLEIKLTSYWSNCEESFFGFFPSPCDAVFETCIDKPGVVDFSDCFYDYKQSGTHEHSSQVDFQDRVGDIPNPRVIGLDHFQTNVVMLAVRVTDHEMVFANRHLATLKQTFSFSPASSEGQSSWTASQMSTTNDYTYRVSFQYRAYCDAYYYTSECDVYCRDRDDHEGHYTCNHTTGEKKCHPGWAGTNCDTDINECLQGPCFNNAQCTNLQGSYECRCPNGFIGQNCDLVGSQCYSSPCQHNGTCSGTEWTYSCICPPQWTGRNCHIPLDVCHSTPCRNNGTCYGSAGQYVCVCAPGWTGENCVTEVNACDSLPCQNGATCRSKPRGEFVCSCAEEYGGQRCELAKHPCSSSPCQNSGTCREMPDYSYTCTCAHGWEGERCEKRTNLCASSPCRNGATCTDTEAGYLCHCPLTWKGDNCTTEVDPCDDLPCQNGGTCMKTSATAYGCACPAEYEGAICEMLKDPCRSNPCFHGACQRESHSLYKCVCEKGWGGMYCHRGRPDGQASRQEQSKTKKLNPLPIVLTLLAVLMLVIIIIVIVFWVRRLKRRNEARGGWRRAGAGLDSVGTVMDDAGRVPSVAACSDFLSFQNVHNAYNESFARGSPHVTLSPGVLPPLAVAGSVKAGVAFYPVKARGEGRVVMKTEEAGQEEEGGAVGGRMENWVKGEKSGSQLNERTGPAGNDYTDFAQLKQYATADGHNADYGEPAEENPYQELNDLFLKWPDECHDVTGSDVTAAAREAAEENVVEAESLGSTGEDEDGGVNQEDLNRLRREVLQKSLGEER